MFPKQTEITQKSCTVLDSIDDAKLMLAMPTCRAETTELYLWQKRPLSCLLKVYFYF